MGNHTPGVFSNCESAAELNKSLAAFEGIFTKYNPAFPFGYNLLMKDSQLLVLISKQTGKILRQACVRNKSDDLIADRFKGKIVRHSGGAGCHAYYQVHPCFKYHMVTGFTFRRQHSDFA